MRVFEQKEDESDRDTFIALRKRLNDIAAIRLDTLQETADILEADLEGSDRTLVDPARAEWEGDCKNSDDRANFQPPDVAKVVVSNQTVYGGKLKKNEAVIWISSNIATPRSTF